VGGIGDAFQTLPGGLSGLTGVSLAASEGEDFMGRRRNVIHRKSEVTGQGSVEQACRALGNLFSIYLSSRRLRHVRSAV